MAIMFQLTQIDQLIQSHMVQLFQVQLYWYIHAISISEPSSHFYIFYDKLAYRNPHSNTVWKQFKDCYKVISLAKWLPTSPKVQFIWKGQDFPRIQTILTTTTEKNYHFRCMHIKRLCKIQLSIHLVLLWIRTQNQGKLSVLRCK